MVFATIAIIIGLIFAKPFSKILSPDLDGETLNLAANYTRIMMFAVYAYLYSSVFRGYLNIKGDFFNPAVTGIIMNVIIIVFTILTGKTGKAVKAFAKESVFKSPADNTNIPDKDKPDDEKLKVSE